MGDMYERGRLARDIYAASHLVGSFVLRSGSVSNEYFDKYLFESNPELLRRISTEMTQLLPNDVQMLGGLELGGIPIATMIGQLTGKPTLFIRKTAKEYGTQKLAEGGDVAGKKIALIEDVITSGGAVIDAALAVRELGGIVEHVICAIDRQQGGHEKLSQYDIIMSSVFTRAELEAEKG